MSLGRCEFRALRWETELTVKRIMKLGVTTALEDMFHVLGWCAVDLMTLSLSWHGAIGPAWVLCNLNRNLWSTHYYVIWVTWNWKCNTGPWKIPWIQARTPPEIKMSRPTLTSRIPLDSMKTTSRAKNNVFLLAFFVFILHWSPSHSVLLCLWCCWCVTQQQQKKIVIWR